MFAPAFDHSFNDLFNQYVNSDPSTSGEGSKDVHFGSDFDQFFSVGSFSSDCGELSPTGSKHFQQSSPQTWRKDTWAVQQDSLNDLQLHRPSTVQPSDVVSGFNAVSLEESSPEALGLLSTSPSSPPATPIRKVHSKSAPITPKNVRVRKANDRATLHRKQTSSPSLMRSAHLQRSKMAYPENWSSRLQQQFNSQLRGDERLPLSPPPSDILVQNESMRRDSGIHLNSSSENLADFSPHYASAMYASKMQQPASFINQHTSTPPPVDDIFATPSSSDSQQLHAWHADALASTFQLTSDLNGHDGHWWSSPLPTRVSQPQNQNSYLVSSLGHKSPMIHTNQHQQQHHHELLQSGLMIDFGSTFELGANPDAFSSAAPLHSTTATHIPTTSHHQPTFSHHPYIPTTHATHQHQFIAKPSRTPSLSPTNTTSPKSRPGVKNTTPRRTHVRKLSSNSTSAPKPVKLSTPTKGGKGSSNVSFVNFTPSDSKKILTGVAPSGSSKTKARREQEAREKRRKLSEAALLAVRNAGGDVEALEAVLC